MVTRDRDDALARLAALSGGGLASDRRGFLRVLGGGLLVGSLAPLLSGCEKNVVEPLTGGTTVPFITPIGDFFVQNGAQASQATWQMPDLDVATHRLVVDGLVPNPRSFSLADLKALAAGQEISLLKTLQCVFDAPLLAGATGLSGNAWWTGIALQTVIEACGGLSAGAARLRLHGAESFTNNLKVARLGTGADPTLPPPIIAWGMNGQALPRAHGAPFRLIVPEMYGYKNVKWLARVEATAADAAFGTYQDAGFFDGGTLAVNSRATAPSDGSRVTAGAVKVSGFALAGAGLRKLEIQLDDGPWEAATLVGPETIQLEESLPWAQFEQVRRAAAFPFPGVWVGWRYDWTATPGAHRLAFRATDALDQAQPVRDTSVFDGTNGITTINVTVT